jgi:hypothetical protein
MTEHEKLAEAFRAARTKILSGFAEQQIAPHLWLDLPGYESPVTGGWIEGRRARREDLKKHGCIEYDPEMKQDAAMNRQRSEEQLDRKIEESVERIYNQMPDDKRKQLEREMNAGVQANYYRSNGNGR